MYRRKLAPKLALAKAAGYDDDLIRIEFGSNSAQRLFDEPPFQDVADYFLRYPAVGGSLFKGQVRFVVVTTLDLVLECSHQLLQLGFELWLLMALQENHSFRPALNCEVIGVLPAPLRVPAFHEFIPGSRDDVFESVTFRFKIELVERRFADILRHPDQCFIKIVAALIQRNCHLD